MIRSNLARSRATAISCQSSGLVQSYPIPVRGPAQPSRPNPAWGLNAQNHIRCIFVIAAHDLPRAWPGPPRSCAAELEVELADLELLVRVRRPLDVLLEPVVLVGLDDRKPREVLEEDLRDVPVGLAAELLVHGKARGAAQLVELGVPPVVHRPAGAEEPPHHAVGVAQRRGRVRPPQALEGLLAALLGAHRVLLSLIHISEPTR